MLVVKVAGSPRIGMRINFVVVAELISDVGSESWVRSKRCDYKENVSQVRRIECVWNKCLTNHGNYSDEDSITMVLRWFTDALLAGHAFM